MVREWVRGCVGCEAWMVPPPSTPPTTNIPLLGDARPRGNLVGWLGGYRWGGSSVKKKAIAAPNIKIFNDKCEEKINHNTTTPKSKNKKGVSVHTLKLYHWVHPFPVSARSEWVVNRRSRRVKASGPVASPVSARHTCANK